MKILVTGGAGFIGSNLVNRLIDMGNKVVVLDDISSGSKENISKKAVFYKKNICDKDIGIIFKKEKPEIVFHFAAKINVRKSIDNPIEDATTNILGGVNILEHCVKFNVKKIIFASSGGGIYGEAKVVPTKESYLVHPLSPYGLSKLTVEQYLEYYYTVFKISYISLRFANVYGPFQNSKNESGVVAIFCNNALRGKEIIINDDGKQARDFVYVDDVVNACIKAMNSKKRGVFNIGTGVKTTINALFDLVKKETDSPSDKKYKRMNLQEQRVSCLSYAKAKKELSWQPKHSLEDGIKNTVKWHTLKIYG